MTAHRDIAVKGEEALKRTAGADGRLGRAIKPSRGKSMLQQSNGTMSKHSLNGHMPINGKEHGSKSGVPFVSPETVSTRAPGFDSLTPQAVKRPSRKPAAKGTTKAKAYNAVPRYAHPYALPRLFDSSTATSGANLEMYCRSTIRAAWEAGEHGNVKAAREHIARCRMTLADIAAMARALADYNNGPWGASPKVDWLSVGAGCVERFGTERDAHLAARSQSHL
jgi:hypothetical protein